MNKNNKLLISSSAKKTIRESVLLAQDLGTGIEISRLPLYKTKGLTLEDTIKIIQSDLEGFENRRTLHAMFSDVNVSSGDVLIREMSQERCLQSFQVGKAINADTILFHTGYKGTLHYGSIESFKKNFIAFWKDFIQEFEKAGIIAVIENVFETSPQFCFDLFKEIGSSNLKLALDTGHVNLYAHSTKVVEWIKLYGENLHHLHLHNNFRTNDDHFNLSNGTLHFEEIFEAIKQEKCNPTFVLEMFSEEDIRKSVGIYNSLMG